MYKSVTIQSGLRIYCADRTKTYSEEASGPSRSEWNGRMPLQFCRRLNCNKGPDYSMEVQIDL